MLEEGLVNMRELLHFQFHRLYKKATPYIFLVIVFFITLSELDRCNNISRYYNYIDGLSYYSRIHENLGMNQIIFSCFYKLELIVSLLIAVFVGIFVTEDRVRGTIKNIYSKGYSRVKIFFSKYIATISLPVLLFFLILIMGFIGALICGAENKSAVTASFSEDTFVLITVFFRYIALTTFFFMLSELVSSTGGAIALNIFSPVTIMIILTMPVMGSLSEQFWNFWLNIMIVFMSLVSVMDTIHFSSPGKVGIIFVGLIVITLLSGALSLLITVKKQIKS